MRGRDSDFEGEAEPATSQTGQRRPRGHKVHLLRRGTGGDGQGKGSGGHDPRAQHRKGAVVNKNVAKLM